MVYVDELKQLVVRRFGWLYPSAAHLWSADAEELEAFARRLGLRRGWKHGDHYDLTEARRGLAIDLGAKPITTRELARLRRNARTTAAQE